MAENETPEVSVVIPTAGETHRVESLRRAIDSILTQEGVAVEVLVMLNGSRYDQALWSELESRKDLRFFYLTQGDQTKAIARGRQAVCGHYFCVLDDDDELVPGTLKLRVERLQREPEADVLVANGYRRNARTGELSLMLEDIEDNAGAPLDGLKRHNWLASCGGLFRTDTIGTDYFLEMPAFFEWTWLAIRLALEKRILFMEQPVFIINDTPGSLSKSKAYMEQEVELIRLILSELPVPKPFRRYLLSKLAAKHIGFANAALSKGCKRRAFRHYLDCLQSGSGGLAYLLWVRKLIIK